jgi:hypothetical protein
MLRTLRTALFLSTPPCRARLAAAALCSARLAAAAQATPRYISSTKALACDCGTRVAALSQASCDQDSWRFLQQHQQHQQHHHHQKNEHHVFPHWVLFALAATPIAVASLLQDAPFISLSSCAPAAAAPPPDYAVFDIHEPPPPPPPSPLMTDRSPALKRNQQPSTPPRSLIAHAPTPHSPAFTRIHPSFSLQRGCCRQRCSARCRRHRHSTTVQRRRQRIHRPLLRSHPLPCASNPIASRHCHRLCDRSQRLCDYD